jgi:hypothetical protein
MDTALDQPTDVTPPPFVQPTPRSPRLPYRQIAAQATAIWLATRIVYVLITYFTALVTSVQVSPGTSASRASFLGWQRFDVGWYVSIATSGYDDPRKAAFFPLYPALIAGTSTVLGDAQHVLSGMLISNIAALVAFFGVGLLAASEDTPEAASGAMRALAAYPLAFFTVAAYADSLFLACAVFALFFARRQHWRAAAACGFLAALTRPVGLILLIPLLWEYGRRRHWWSWLWRWWTTRGWRQPSRIARLTRARLTRARLTRARLSLGGLAEAALVIGAIPAALALYAAFLWWRFGDPLLFVHAEQLGWHRAAMPIWQALGLDAGSLFAAPPLSLSAARIWLDALPVVAILALTLWNLRRMPPAFAFFMLGLLYLALSAPKADNGIPLAAAGRYLLPSVPIFLLLGHWIRRSPALDTIVVCGGFALQALFTAFFLTGGYLI